MNTVTCDTCGLSVEHSHHGTYGTRLLLRPERVSPKGDRFDVSDVALPVAMKRDMHFCGLACLEKWVIDRKDRLPKIA